MTKTEWLSLLLRGEQEGWGIFDSDTRGLEVERLDERDGAEPLATDDDAVRLARAAGLDLHEDGRLARGTLISYLCAFDQ